NLSYGAPKTQRICLTSTRKFRRGRWRGLRWMRECMAMCRISLTTRAILIWSFAMCILDTWTRGYMSLRSLRCVILSPMWNLRLTMIRRGSERTHRRRLKLPHSLAFAKHQTAVNIFS
ncbi:hypothetical protein GGF45_001638, partial [Coemansia sp. RSA 551]